MTTFLEKKENLILNQYETALLLGQDILEGLELLKTELQKNITPLDIVGAILFFFEKDEFSTDYEKLHEAFYKVKDSPLLDEFSFRKGGPYPYSELLENIFSRLTISGLLGCKNPDYRKFTISQKQRKRIKNGILNNFS